MNDLLGRNEPKSVKIPRTESMTASENTHERQGHGEQSVTHEVEEEVRTIDEHEEHTNDIHEDQPTNEPVETAFEKDYDEERRDQAEENNDEKKKNEFSFSNLTEADIIGDQLTSGSQRMSAKMYDVVRKIIESKKCMVCGQGLVGANLPGLTYLKTNVKPFVKSN